MIRTGPFPHKGGGPLLKRPFSLHRIGPDDEISILYRVAGVGTELMSRLRPDDDIEILGPLGNGFRVIRDLSTAYLVAGGIGVAPMTALIDSFSVSTKIHLFYGAMTAGELITEKYPDYFGKRVILEACTDDGSACRMGLATDLLEEALQKTPAPLYACGPRPMLAAVAAIAEKYNVEAQVSLEAHMACGMGACLGCATEMKSDKESPVYARVCMEGPVFAAEEVKW